MGKLRLENALMKLRSTAALALVTWYLMLPPSLSKTSKDKSMAALSRWRIVHEFDAEKSCDAERIKWSKVDSTLYRGMPAEDLYDAEDDATNDTRLKTN